MASSLVVSDHLPAIIAALHHGVAAAVAETAREIADAYRDNAPEATGFMASSAYVVTHDGSTYGQGLQGTGTLLPEVEKPTSDLDALAAVGADYAAYQEYGTMHDPAHPAFHPALDTAKGGFEQRLGDLASVIERVAK